MSDFTKLFSKDNTKAMEHSPKLERAMVVILAGVEQRMLLDCYGDVIEEERNNLGKEDLAAALGTEKDAQEPTDGVWVWEGHPHCWSEYDSYNGDWDGGVEFVGKWRRPTAEEWNFACNEEHVWDGEFEEEPPAQKDADLL